MNRRSFSLLLPLWVAGLLGATGAARAASETHLAVPPPIELLRVYVPRGIDVPSDTTYRIFRDGTEFVVHQSYPDSGQASCAVSWGVLAPAAYVQLSAALANGQVGKQSGQCGIQASSRGPGFITVTWYGQKGRTTFFRFGTGSQEDCPAGIQEILAALPLLGANEVQLLTVCPPPS